VPAVGGGAAGLIGALIPFRQSILEMFLCVVLPIPYGIGLKVYRKL
jgi:hypothetical protein